MLDFLANTDLLLEQVQIRHPCVHTPVLNLFLSRVPLLQVTDDDLMNLETQFFLYLTAYRGDDVLSEGLVDFFFVVVDSCLGGV
jgi:hypothetical protein